MQQVLFEIPFPGFPDGIPIYGFGMMLFLAFVVCTWLAARRARQEGVPPERIQDLAVWIFFTGIIGARLTYILTEDRPFAEFPRIWDGGLVFYGSILGGAVGYALAYWFVLRKHQITNAKVADILAPALAMGICLGRLGCFLNGCCYGHVNEPHWTATHFPLSSPPRFELVEKGYQTPAGFTMSTEAPDERTVGAVAPGSAAAIAGLREGDMIVRAGERAIGQYADLFDYLTRNWPRGKKNLELTVQRDGAEVAVGPFEPRTLGLHPTQLYSSVGGLLMFLMLQAYYPLRRRDGAVMALLMLAYPLERFLEEMLRSDNPPLTWGLTFSQNVSVYLFLAGILFTLWLWSRPVQYTQPGAA